MKYYTIKPFAFVAVAALLCVPTSGFAQSILQTAGNFALLGGTAVTSDGTAGTIITNGNVGSAIAVSGFSDINGGAGPAVITPPGIAITSGAVVGQAILDLGTAKVGLAGMASTATMSSVDLGGKTLAPGVYTFGAAATQTGALVLDAQGKNNVFWVFQIGTTLTTGVGSTVTLINPGSNGGADDGIFWVAETGGINFGSSNKILGNYLAATTISATTNTNGTGGSRALSQAGVTLVNDQINAKGGPGGSDWTGGLKFSGGGNVVPSAGSNTSSRIVNFSARALSGPGDQTLIMGFVVAGDNKHLLLRGIGPTLSVFGIVNFLADPLLTLFNGPSAIATNDNWQIDSNSQDQAALIQAADTQAGAFTLPNGSKDSAMLFTVNNGAHTSGLLRPNSTTGVALTEIYDMDTVANSRLINVSARMNVTTGEGTLIAGLVIAGNAPKTVLIRGVGPTLSVFGVGGLLADPQISVVAGGTQIGSNDNWETGTSTAAQISTAAAQVGAFALSSGSKDAALLITLQPGSYTVVVTGVGNTTGVALVEIYDVL